MKSLIFLLFLVLLLVPSVDAAGTEQKYKQIRQEYIALLGSSQAQRQRHNWLKVIKALESFSESKSAGRRKDDSMFLLGRSWHGLAQASGRDDDARTAIKVYERLAKTFPDSNLADDALIYAAEISLDTFSDQTSAYNYYLQVTTELPPGDMLGEAASRLKRLATSAPTRLPAASTARTKTKPGTGRLSELSGIRVWTSEEYTRIVLDLSRSSSYEPHRLSGKDPRLYVDLKNAQLAPGLTESRRVRDGIVSGIRSSNLDQKTVRVVLDLARTGDYKVFSLSEPDRIVIDVSKPDASISQKKTGNDSIAGILDDIPKSAPPVLHVPQHDANEGIRLIVIDAGHGGRDPGAIGRNKTREKDITLQLAKKLAEALRKEIGCKVLMTRKDDRYIKLHDRTAFANKVGADLFISLHANASPNRRAYGLETYYLNLAKNNQAAEVAARENNTSLEEVSNLEAILFDLMANAKINESSRLAAEIQQAMVSHLKPKYSHIKDLGVRQGPFHVLLGATMPSVLVETAFISNSREEKRLQSSAYQKRIAQAIVRGVKDYRETLEQVARR